MRLLSAAGEAALLKDMPWRLDSRSLESFSSILLCRTVACRSVAWRGVAWRVVGGTRRSDRARSSVYQANRVMSHHTAGTTGKGDDTPEPQRGLKDGRKSQLQWQAAKAIDCDDGLTDRLNGMSPASYTPPQHSHPPRVHHEQTSTITNGTINQTARIARTPITAASRRIPPP